MEILINKHCSLKFRSRRYFALFLTPSKHIFGYFVMTASSDFDFLLESGDEGAADGGARDGYWDAGPCRP